MKKRKKTPKTRSVVINCCYGGFSISVEAALTLYNEGWKELGTPVKEYFNVEERGRAALDEHLANWRAYLRDESPDAWSLSIFSPDEKFVISDRPIQRDDPRLVKVVKRLGKKADGNHASLEVVKIPADVEWEICEYDGIETIHETHRSWP